MRGVREEIKAAALGGNGGVDPLREALVAWAALVAPLKL